MLQSTVYNINRQPNPSIGKNGLNHLHSKPLMIIILPGFLRPIDVYRVEDSAIILKRLKQLGKSPLYSNSIEEQRSLLEKFSRKKANQEFLPKSLVMIDAPLTRVVPERAWQYSRILLVTIEKIDFRQNVPMFKVRNLDGTLLKGHFYK